ncbi:MAG: hypothetical protein LUF29_03220 [Oscillospiraceae bacterium]|nr:hypothetical protein [Oscillospiraceae bacterium]
MARERFMTKEKIKTNEANRDRIIYMLSIDRAPDLSQLDPPATKEEEEYYKELYAEMRKTEEEYKAAGKKLIWDIPFDLDYD